jgi:hypothetical protein
MRSNVLRMELLIASILPVAAILLIGMESLKRMEHIDIGLFLFILFACIVGVFIGEVLIIRLMQRATKAQFHEIVLACQEYIAGNRARRLTVHGDNALVTLTRVLNTLFEVVAHEKASPEVADIPRREQPIMQSPLFAQKDNSKQLQQLDSQVQQLIREITPVKRGDLRVRASLPAGNVGVVAEICNALIEEIVELVQWTRYSAEQVINGTSTLLGSSIELAEVIETQLSRFSQTTEEVEKLVAFLQRLNNSLQLSVEMIQGIRDYLQKQMAQTPAEAEFLLERLDTDTRRQAQLLERVLSSTQSNIALAESMISDFYTFAQRIHQSSTTILQTVETINILAKLAEQWRNAVIAFQLPDESLQQLAQAPGVIRDVNPGSERKHHSSNAPLAFDE